MFRHLPFLTIVVLSFTDPVWAQPGGFQDNIEGVYIHEGSGKYCRVTSQGRSFIFQNEKGSQARFVYDAPGQLRLVEHDGGWDRNIRVQVTQSRFGRPVLRFETRSTTDHWRLAH